MGCHRSPAANGAAEDPRSSSRRASKNLVPTKSEHSSAASYLSSSTLLHLFTKRGPEV